MWCFPASGGEVQVNRVVKGLGHGLDEAATRAAQQIKFKPALSNGHRGRFSSSDSYRVPNGVLTFNLRFGGDMRIIKTVLVVLALSALPLHAADSAEQRPGAGGGPHHQHRSRRR